MKLLIIYLAALLILFTSCANSVISVSDKSKPYTLIVNGRNYKNTDAKVPRSGLPQSKKIIVKDARGNIIGNEVITRDFNAGKFIVSLIFFYSCLQFVWQHCVPV